VATQLAQVMPVTGKVICFVVVMFSTMAGYLLNY
jgi:hypothetical protein